MEWREGGREGNERERGGKGEGNGGKEREGRLDVEGYTVSSPVPVPLCHYHTTTY